MEQNNKYTKKICDFILNTRYEDLPEKAIENAKGRILDSIGCGIAGTTEETGVIVKKFLVDNGGNEQATVINSKIKSSLTSSAFANGILMHSMDYDDNSMPAMAHTTTCVLPAALAVGQYVGASGKDILLAYIIGHEVFNKVAACLTTECWYKGFHGTGIFGAFGSVAAAGKLLGLNEDEMTRALGIAASSFTGIKQNMGSMTKPYHAGRAAESGVRACLLAKWGYTSKPNAFEGPQGYVHVFSSEPRWENIDEIGKVWEIVERPPFIKPHPSCGGTHAAMNALLQLIREYNFDADDVDYVDVGANAGVPGQLLYHDAKDTLEAKFCIEFCLSLLLKYRKWGLSLHTQEMVDNPEIKALYPKIKVHIDEELSKRLPPEFADLTSIVTVKLKDGTTYELEADCPDFTYDEIVEKFWDTSGLAVSRAQAEKVESIIRDLDKLDNVAALMDALA
jgi:2-methylcitrate dehydratase PrpD